MALAVRRPRLVLEETVRTRCPSAVGAYWVSVCKRCRSGQSDWSLWWADCGRAVVWAWCLPPDGLLLLVW